MLRVSLCLRGPDLPIFAQLHCELVSRHLAGPITGHSDLSQNDLPIFDISTHPM